MRRNLHRRLGQLEEKHAAAREARRHASVESPIPQIREILRANNFEQGPRESLAETFARFLGMSSRELNSRLMERAYGRSVGGF
jgi:AraC-like DNA-binding protein